MSKKFVKKLYSIVAEKDPQKTPQRKLLIKLEKLDGEKGQKSDKQTKLGS